MKNNKGFTLVEILAVVAVLILIIAIITPKIFKQFQNAEKITNQEQINTIINIAKIYMNQNSELLPKEGREYNITLQELKNSGLISTSQILNPSTKQELQGYISVKYINNKYNYKYIGPEYQEQDESNEIDENSILVTFDANGGTVKTPTKKVVPGEKYGKLPIPTRRGYTFLGWNGKNKFNKEKYRTKADYTITDYVYKDAAIELKPNTTYKISIIAYNDYKSKDGTLLINNTSSGIYSGNWSSIAHTSAGIIEQTSHTTGNDGNLYIGYSTNDTSNLDIIWQNIDVQIEEGTEKTPYEPYIIKSTTTVVQENDHTLTALWKQN
jgi:uncharacterized repeat protein (TIGR02543 family)